MYVFCFIFYFSRQKHHCVPRFRYDGSRELPALHFIRSNDDEHASNDATRTTSSCHLPATVESDGGNVMRWDDKLQQLVAVSFDHLVVSDVLGADSAAKTIDSLS